MVVGAITGVMPYANIEDERKNRRQRDARYKKKRQARREQLRNVKAASGREVTIPVGHRVKGFSTRRDGAGETQQEWTKTTQDPVDPPEYPVKPPGWAITSTATGLDAEGKAFAQWVRAEPKLVRAHDAFVAAVRASLEPFRGIVAPTRAPRDVDRDLCAVYGFGDPHFGMLARGKETGDRNFDLKIAEEEFEAAGDLLVDRAPPAHTAICCDIGDSLHFQDDTQLTPAHKNKVDGDGRFEKVSAVVLRTRRSYVAKLLKKHRRVVMVQVPGNHDPNGARMLRMFWELVYENEPRVEVLQNSNAFIYYRFGANLFAFNHGMVKPEKMGPIIAADCAAGGIVGLESWWGECRWRRCFTGHLHHRQADEFPGLEVERLQTLAAREAYANEAGYRHKSGAVQITFHRTKGERLRQRVFIDEVRDHAKVSA